MTEAKLAKLIAAAVAAALSGTAAKGNKGKARKNYGTVAKRQPAIDTAKLSPAVVSPKTDRLLKRHAAVVKGFNAKGFKNADIKLHENVKTYKGWLAEGRQVRKGQHGVKGLFHVSQTDEVRPEKLPSTEGVKVTVLPPETREHFDAKMAPKEVEPMHVE